MFFLTDSELSHVHQCPKSKKVQGTFGLGWKYKGRTVKDQLKQVSQELEGTKSLLQAVARETGVNFIDEEDDEEK